MRLNFKKRTRWVLTVKGDCDQKDNEIIADSDAESHSDENAMEENSQFQHDTLHAFLASPLFRR